GNGYNTSYYFVTSGLTTLFELYHENPSITGEELRNYLIKEDYEFPGSTGIPIRFYIDKPGINPTDELVDKIYREIYETDGIPGGRYSIILNDNFINPRTARGEMDNTISKDFPKEGDL